MNREKKRRRMARKRLLLFTGCTLVLAIILLAISFGAIFVSLHIPDLEKFLADNYSVRYYMAENQSSSQARFSYDPDFILRDGNLYLDFSTLAELCGFAVSGDYEQRRYLLGGEDEDTLLVTLGTTTVNLSGQPVALRTPSFLSQDGSLYLPCEFVDSYFDGITIVADEKDDHIIRVVYDTESGFGLTLHRSEACGEVAPPDMTD